MVSFVKAIIPTPTAVVREALIVIGGLLLAAYVISKFPSAQKFIQDSSINLKDGNGKTIL